MIPAQEKAMNTSSVWQAALQIWFSSSFHKPPIIFGSTWLSSSGFHHPGRKKQGLSAYPGSTVSREAPSPKCSGSWGQELQMNGAGVLWRRQIKDRAILQSILKSTCGLITMSQGLHTAVDRLFLALILLSICSV